jgi:RNA polymerase-binding transcription factor DksA
MDKSSDVNDNASELETLFREAAILDARLKKQPPAGFDGKSCVECGEDIMQERLALCLYTCIDCQSVIEKRKKFYRS